MVSEERKCKNVEREGGRGREQEKKIKKAGEGRNGDLRRSRGIKRKKKGNTKHI